MADQTILLVDDDENIGYVTKEYLQARGWKVEWVISAEEAMERFESTSIDICIFDINLPGKTGFELAKDIRLKSPQIPIIFLTARAEVSDVKKGFLEGADDYIRKPFSVEELILRIEAILRRSGLRSRTTKKLYRFGDCQFDPRERLLSHPDASVILSSKESQLLDLLVNKKNETVDRALIVQSIWGADAYVKGRTLDVHISRLRKYLQPDRQIEITNTRGMGYKLIVKA